MTDPAAPAPAAPAPASAPGKTLGIVGLVFAFVFALLGLILSIAAKVQSNRAGVKNTPATAGIVVSIIVLVGYVIIGIALAGVLGGVVAECANLGPGVHVVGGVTYTCS